MWVIGQHLPIDWGVVVCTIILTLLGSLMVLSASSYTMSVKGEDALGEFKTQLFGMAVGGVGFFFAMAPGPTAGSSSAGWSWRCAARAR